MKRKPVQDIVPDDIVLNKIYLIRGHKVMLDRDLSELYGVETKQLKRQVNRNSDRFPEDFMFEMTNEELDNWRRQFGTSKSEKLGLRYTPYCFSEQGVAMLSSVPTSKQAVQVNINIMRVFTRVRQMLTDNTELKLAIEEIRKKTDNNTKNIEIVFQYLDELLQKKEEPLNSRPAIGFKQAKKRRKLM